jgi:hypothetical protein
VPVLIAVGPNGGERSEPQPPLSEDAQARPIAPATNNTCGIEAITEYATAVANVRDFAISLTNTGRDGIAIRSVKATFTLASCTNPMMNAGVAMSGETFAAEPILLELLLTPYDQSIQVVTTDVKNQEIPVGNENTVGRYILDVRVRYSFVEAPNTCQTSELQVRLSVLLENGQELPARPLLWVVTP